MTDPFAPLRLDGKVPVVTGSTQGLGAAIARRAAALGAAAIVVCGRDRARGEEQDIAPMACHRLSDAATMVTASVSDFDQTVLGIPA